MVTGDATPGDAKLKKGTQTKLSRNSRSVTRFSVKVINRGLCRRESSVRSSIEETPLSNDISPESRGLLI